MRHLIVCCDGTWNTADQEAVTNVRRLYNALAPTDDAGRKQLARHLPGVGTAGGLASRLVGGAFGLALHPRGRLTSSVGLGLDEAVMEGYHWLVTTYQPEDRIALFGFSRGAYTARSLAGLIAMCGLISTAGMGEEETWRRINDVYDRYRQGPHGDPHWRDGLTFLYDPTDAEKIPVQFIGVWDTVGSLGIPDHLRWFAPAFSASRYAFHDVKLNPNVKHGRHAVAMDERRGPFSPTLWGEPEPGQDVKQVWFPGSHMDVGGGHRETGLSDRALQWMIDEAKTAIQLGFHKKTEEQIKPDALDVVHDDDRTALGWLNPLLAPGLEPFLALRPRAVPLVDPDASQPAQELDISVYDRQQAPPITSGPYRPTRVLARGESATVEVRADESWDDTGLYLQSGSYHFTSEGEWLDRDIPSSPDGNGGIRLRQQPIEGALRGVGTLSTELEKLFRRQPGSETAYVPLARREPDLPWMSLVGYVANDAIAVNGGSKTAHQRIAIGRDRTHYVTKGGYFYAFANDAWGFYGNNHGTVRLTVTRIPEDA